MSFLNVTEIQGFIISCIVGLIYHLYKARVISVDNAVNKGFPSFFAFSYFYQFIVLEFCETVVENGKKLS